MTPETETPDTRQRLHPLTVLFTGLTIARRLVLPAIIAFISAKQRDISEPVLWIGLIAVVPSLVGATAKYQSFRYRLTDDALVVDSGVFVKQHRVIPLESVQNIDIRESALQRVLGVATIRVETAAGSSTAEAEFAVLGRETADILRSGILTRRRARPGPIHSEESAPAGSQGAVRETILVQLSPSDLIVAGATANHAGLIVAALAGAFQLIDDLPYLSWASRLLERLPTDSLFGAIVIGLGAIAILLVAGWVFSIIGSVVRYYDFTLKRSDDQLHNSHGLLGRHRTIVPLRRVQALRIEESILRRPLALAAMKVTTAGSPAGEQDRGGAETIAPVARVSDVSRLVTAIFPALDYGAVALSPVHPRSRSRAFTRYAIFLLVLAAAVALWRTHLTFVPFLLLPAAWLLAAWQYRHRGYATIPGYVVARNGVLNRITWLVPEQKLQTLHLKESPFQRRHGLASVVLDTAGGGAGRAVVRDLAYSDAERLVDSLRR